MLGSCGAMDKRTLMKQYRIRSRTYELTVPQVPGSVTRLDTRVGHSWNMNGCSSYRRCLRGDMRWTDARSSITNPPYSVADLSPTWTGFHWGRSWNGFRHGHRFHVDGWLISFWFPDA